MFFLGITLLLELELELELDFFLVFSKGLLLLGVCREFFDFGKSFELGALDLESQFFVSFPLGRRIFVGDFGTLFGFVTGVAQNILGCLLCIELSITRIFCNLITDWIRSTFVTWGENGK